MRVLRLLVALVFVAELLPRANLLMSSFLSGKPRPELHLLSGLRADGVRVSVFRREKTTSGDWREATVQQQTQVQLEDAILARARQFKTESLEK